MREVRFAKVQLAWDFECSPEHSWIVRCSHLCLRRNNDILKQAEYRGTDLTYRVGFELK